MTSIRDLPSAAVLFAFLSVLASLCVAATPLRDPVSFDAFIAPFTPEQQRRARAVWEEIDASVPDAPRDVGTDEISDEDLLASLTPEDRASSLAQLQELRSQLSGARAERDRAERAFARWQSLADRLKDMPDMEAVHLGALSVATRCRALIQDAEDCVLSLEKQIRSRRVDVALDEIAGNFTGWDWGVIVVYLAFTTVLGGLLAGKQASMKDFFLGGRRLPWPAVCGSIIATELSAATFLIAPAIVFSQGGDMTYIQLAFGTILARFVIGYFFVPVYYKREIYSPYEYMGHQLGPRVKYVTSGLFMVGGILAQGARVYIAAKALQVITGTDTATSIIIIGAVSIGWTIMGGITTVIWTDAIQCLLFTLGAIAALVFASSVIDGGLATIVSEAYHAGKLRAINLSFDPRQAYTLWCGLIGLGVLTLASHGTDQLMVQRMFTCRNAGDARKAVIFSGLSQLVTYLLLFVGAAVYVYYQHFPLSTAEQVVVDNDSMKIFAIYIVDVMPPVLSGLLMAAIFATAISTLDSLLAALSQSTIALLYKPYLKPEASDRHYVRASRVIVVIWGVLLTAFAISCDTIAQSYGDLIQFALAMAAYTYGALLGVFLLAFLPTKRDDLGLMWGVPLSTLLVFALNWHQKTPKWIVAIACAILLVQAVRHLWARPVKIVFVAVAVGLVLAISLVVVGRTPEGESVYFTLAWPWQFPIGTVMTLAMGYFVGNKRP